MRYVVCGGPRSGKSTLGRRLAVEYKVPLLSTDEPQFIQAPWSDVPDLVIAALRGHQEFVLEGVQAARVLRRWLNSKTPPELDGVYWLETAVVERTDGQASMAKGVATVFADVRPLLAKRGIPVFPGLPKQWAGGEAAR